MGDQDEKKSESSLEAGTPDPTPVFSELVPVESRANTEAHDAASIAAAGSVAGAASTAAVDESVYDRYSPRRKAFFVAILSFCAILSPISSTGSLTAVPEIAATFDTTGSIINITNGLYTAAMGISAFLWGALSTLGGRQVVLYSSAIAFFLCSIGTALSPNLAAFFVFRMLSGFGGTGLLVSGPGCIGDVYKPTERGTAIGWFMSGTLIGPALGPLIGGAIVTYIDWRYIYWVQTAMAGLASILAVAFIPETIHQKRWTTIPKDKRLRETASALNPLKLLALLRHINILLVSLASSSLVWNMYSFLVPIVYVINPRLGLTTSLQSGLFYLAPGSGYLVGTLFGGRWADRTVKLWIRKRDGVRKPEDRLRSAVPWMGIGIPACMLVYGWCLEFDKGGIPVIVIAMFVQGFCQLMIFPSVNTYCLDLMPTRSAEVTAANYLVRYLFGAAGSAIVLPAIDKIGVGAFTTISAGFVAVACGGLLLVIHDLTPRRWRKA
ncbi:major facilitator superfamily domain-containing protein [Xylariales sp. PMI_506]|nr:major facilitator superfamily domain-containing protein [Xylariales sp. PMI_506]